MRASFLNQGEICLSGSRAYVQRPIYDQFMEKLLGKTKEQVVGDPLQSATKVGALISKEHFERVSGYLELARKEGGSSLQAAEGRRG